MNPTIGRVIWYYPAGISPPSQPWPAFITFVHSNTLINVGGFDKNGKPFADQSVALLSEDETMRKSGGGSWASWMPYQLGQAAKTQALEKSLAEGHIKEA